jgi:hypothetical protein
VANVTQRALCQLGYSCQRGFELPNLIGSALFRQAQNCLRGDGHKTAVLTVLSNNPTVEFYGRMGGKVSRETQAGFGGKQLDERVMCFEL